MYILIYSCFQILPFYIYGKIVVQHLLYFTAAVFQAKNDPFKKEPTKKEAEDKASSSKSSDKRSSTGIKLTNKWVTEKFEVNLLLIESTIKLVFFMCRAQPSYKKEDKKSDKVSEKEKESKSGKSGSVSSNSGQESLKKDDRKHGSRFILPITNLPNPVDLISVLMSGMFIFIFS